MSSGFVSGGTTEQPIERDDEWLKAQQEIEDNRRVKEEQSRQQGGKSLYEILQDNKAAKQEAFEESIRLKNQFRNLDEDEIEFLDSVLESTRAKEEAVKKETGEQLDVFRKAQEEADRQALLKEEEGGDGNNGGSPTGGEETSWAVGGRKRKRGKEKEGFKGLKIRRGSEAIEVNGKATLGEKKVLDGTPDRVAPRAHGYSYKQTASTQIITNTSKSVEAPSSDGISKATSVGTSPVPTSQPTKPLGLGLAGYSSEEDE